MESVALTSSNKIVNCDSCYATVDQNDTFCTNCGYPLKGSETEQREFMMDKNYKEINLSGAMTQVKRASYALYYIAGATMIMGLIIYATNKDVEIKNDVLIMNTILAFIYAALGYWSTRKPLTAIISGALLYALVFILNAVTNPITIASGIIFKIFIVVYFIRGIKAAIEADKLKKELNIE